MCGEVLQQKVAATVSCLRDEVDRRSGDRRAHQKLPVRKRLAVTGAIGNSGPTVRSGVRPLRNHR